MIKKCVGCGQVMQGSDKNKPGYTPNISNTYCMRCFKLKHYGKIDSNETINNEDIIAKINKKKGLVFFLVDFLNINQETMDIFKMIKQKKILVISKSDTLRKEMRLEKIKLWLNKVYKIEGEVILNSVRKSFNVFNYLDKSGDKTCFLMGITNAGKSTYLNKILKSRGKNKEIVVSSKPNTTLDFIKFRIDDYIIYDTPGFTYSNQEEKLIKKEIKPITYNINKEICLVINDKYRFYFDKPNSVTLYITSDDIKKIYKSDNESCKIKVFNNSDIVVPGLGFMNVKREAVVMSNIKNLEVRASISGVDYE